MKQKFERQILKNKLVITGLLCCLFGTMGCVNAGAGNQFAKQCSDGICTSNREYTAVCIENADGYSECNDNTNVNYTRTAADFREYGERTPRDHRITQAGAGNNISASIPPSIDNEVIDYEMTVAGAAPSANGAPAANGVPAPAASPVAANGGFPTTGSVPYTAGSGISNAPAQHNIPDYENYLIDNPEQAENAPTASGDDSASEEADQNKDWLAEEGQSLKTLLTQWSEEAGWRLIWKTNRNYTLNAGAMFRGNFADVASALIRAFARARPAPIATFYKGNRVLVVETMEDENAYD